MTGAACGTARLIWLPALCAAAIGLGACGTQERPPGPVTLARAGPAMQLDPALATLPRDVEAVWLVYTPLLTYRHADGEKGAELIPGLASDLPEVSDDGRTYTLELRKGLEYANGRTVRAGDFERAIARTLWLRSPGAPLYSGIVGAREYMRSVDPEVSIEGIETDDETGRITIRLLAPDPGFADALALPYAAPVGPRAPFRDLTDRPPPGVGVYRVSPPSRTGGFFLALNPTFADLDIPDIPTGNVAVIRVVVIGDRARQAQDVLDGKLDAMQAPAPPPLARTIAKQAGDRLVMQPTPATAYFGLNRAREPFADPLVREAVNRGLDRAALARAYGELRPGCAMLGPGVPGYDRALDTADCPYGDPDEPPDRAAARALVRQAGARGARVNVARGVGPAAQATTRAYIRGLRAIGLRARVARGEQVPETGLRLWAARPPRAGALLGAVARGDPLVAAELGRLGAAGSLEQAAGDWRRLDLYVVSPPQSYAAPIGHPLATTFFSERMDPKGVIFSPVFGDDYSSWQLKQGE